MAENESKLSIRGKTVYQSEPFSPRTEYFSRFTGRESELKLITAAWMASDFSLPMSPLLIGEPGVGKNRLIYELALKTGRQLYIFQGHEDVTSEDLACTVRFSDNSSSVMDYMISPLVTAMHNGGICFIDEIGKIRPRALALLVSVLDERRYIDSILLGERIHAHPGFRFVAATNTADLNLLPEFIISRMRPQISVGFPPKEEIDSIIRDQCKGTRKEVERLINHFWMLWMENGGQIGAIAPRDAIYLFGWASKLSSFENTGGSSLLAEANNEKPFRLLNEDFTNLIKPEHLEQAFQKLFSDKPSIKN
jgi:Holliday junction resolvasome RuvABC ATP-dependent DNA helicase subunit